MAHVSSPGVRISLLGGVRIEIEGAGPVDPLPRKCQELLAALALDPQTSVPVGRLVTLIWGDDPPRTAERPDTFAGQRTDPSTQQSRKACFP